MSQPTRRSDVALFERRGHLAIVTLNRPEILNAVNGDMTRRAGEVLEEIDGDPELRVAIITGSGRAFCAGADLKAIQIEAFGSTAIGMIQYASLAIRSGMASVVACVWADAPLEPERPSASGCGSPSLEWAPARGVGHVVSWTAIHTRPDGSGATRVSVVVGIVELDEGPWLRARLLAADPAGVRSGAEVTLEILQTEGEPIYAFRLTGKEGTGEVGAAC